MTKSALQIARAAYQPKLPKALKGAVKAVAGAATQSVADQEAIQKLFPNTYGMPLIKFEATDEVVNFPAMNVGVILSGGQAPGGHNVISGIFDGIQTSLTNTVTQVVSISSVPVVPNWRKKISLKKVWKS